MLPPGGIFAIAVVYHATKDDTAYEALTLHISRADGSLSHDTTITFRAAVFGQREHAQAFPTAIEDGPTYTCEERDTFVIVQHSGCDTLCISSLTLSGTGFTLTRGDSIRCLPPGQRDTIGLQTGLDTTGHPSINADTLSILSNAVSTIAPIPLSRGIAYPVPWALRLSAAGSATAGTQVTYKVLQRGQLPADVIALEFTLSYEDDLLGFASADEPSVVPIGASRDAARILHQQFRIAPVGSDSILATLHFLPYVAPDTETAIVLDSISLTSSLGRPSDCIASTSEATSAFTLLPKCGNPILRYAMGRTLTLDGIVPNPTNGHTTLRYSLGTGQAILARLTIEDALGRTVAVLSATLVPGSGHEILLTVASLPAGMYLLRLTVPGFERTTCFIRE